MVVECATKTTVYFISLMKQFIKHSLLRVSSANSCDSQELCQSPNLGGNLQLYLHTLFYNFGETNLKL